MENKCVVDKAKESEIKKKNVLNISKNISKIESNKCY